MSAPHLEVESSSALPLVHFQLIFPGGSLTDPAGQEGLARLSARLLRRGTQSKTASEVELAIDSLGAELGIETSHTYVRVAGSVIRRNAEPLLALVGELVREPALGEHELGQLKRETLASLTEMLDNDSVLAGVRCRRMLFRDHPFGRSLVGTRSSVQACSRDAVIDYHARWIAPGPSLVGFAGDVSHAEAERWVRDFIGVGRDEPALDLPEPPSCEQRVLCVVDKPARTQTQIYVGRPGTLASDPDHHALVVGNAVFGGTFTSRLMKAVRSERGWSYGASSRLGVDRVRDCWTMWTHPAASDAPACLALQLSLMESWVHEGVSDAEVEFAKSYLIKSYAFSVDTADKRLDQRVEQRLLGLPEDYFSAYTDHIAAVDAAQVRKAVADRLDPAQLCISILATEADVGPRLREHVPVDRYEVWPHDREG